MIHYLDLVRLIGRARLTLSNEAAAQDDLEAFFVEHGVAFEREFRLTAADRPDFMVEGVAVELKANRANATQIIGQLARYAAHPDVKAVVLLSNRAVALPKEIEGKPAFFVSMGRAWL